MPAKWQWKKSTQSWDSSRVHGSLTIFYFKISEFFYHRLVGFYAHPTQYVVNTLYWPHTALSVYLVCYFLVPHTHVLCMGSGSATGKKFQVRLVHSLLKYFFKFQLWYWIKNLHYQIFKFVIDNSDISLNCLQHIQKRRNFDAKVTCHQPICLLLHAILSGVGVGFMDQNALFQMTSTATKYFPWINTQDCFKDDFGEKKLWPFFWCARSPYKMHAALCITYGMHFQATQHGARSDTLLLTFQNLEKRNKTTLFGKLKISGLVFEIFLYSMTVLSRISSLDLFSCEWSY